MSYTRLNLRDSIRATLPDQNVWKDAALNQWINDAIHEYSGYFPYNNLNEITTSNGTREYSLTASGTVSVFNITTVRYPVATIPPRYLYYKSRQEADFYGGPYYDITGDPPETIILGETPSANQGLHVFYQTTHTLPSGDSSALTISVQHLNLLRDFVIWKALAFLEGYAAIDPGRKASMITAIGKSAAQAEKFYYYQLQKVLSSSIRSGATGPWAMDKKDRIY